jgi:glycosyltransferase involved in cell wall biosynthesis
LQGNVNFTISIMKIGIVCYPTFGGSGVLATELGMALSLKGHEIHFISYQPPVRLSFHPNIFYHEVTVQHYPLFDFPPYETALASTLAHVITNNNLDLLHVHYAIPHASAAYFAREILRKSGRDIPYITTLHGTDITAVSQNLKEETFRNFPIEKEIQVIPNFVDTSRFYQTNKEHFKKMLAPQGERILAHVSNFRKVKRVDDVIRVFEQVRKKIPSKLLMIGDGPERPAAEELCRSLNICSDIRFLGKQEQMDEILSITDLFILPSQYESFGLSALEAMACGVPVISTNAGGLPEINIQGKTGFLSEIGHIDDMAQNAVYILSDDAILAQFKEEALKQAQKFEKSGIIPLYEKLYEDVVNAYKQKTARTLSS